MDLRPYAREVSRLPPSISSILFACLSDCVLTALAPDDSTLSSTNGLKTRNFGTIISELTSCIRIHQECGSCLGGVSLEFTGELTEDGFSVTECLGGSMGLSEDQLPLRYQVSRIQL